MSKVTPERVAKVVRHTLLHICMILIASFGLFPFIWTTSSSFKNLEEFYQLRPSLLPRNPTLMNYAYVFRGMGQGGQESGGAYMLLLYRNSFYTTTVSMIFSVLIAALAGYAFARIPFWGSSIIFLLLLSALMMPPEVTILPNFLMMQKLNLINTHIPLIILPILGSNGVMSTFMMRQFFLNLPKELEEAARIDGLDRPGIFFRVILPNAKPALAAVAILTFLYSWNSFLEPLIYLNDIKLFTLPLSLRNFTDAYGQPLWNVQLAATVMAVVPVLIFYILAQRQVVESFSFSGSKG